MKHVNSLPGNNFASRGSLASSQTQERRGLGSFRNAKKHQFNSSMNAMSTLPPPTIVEREQARVDSSWLILDVSKVHDLHSINLKHELQKQRNPDKN